MNRLLSAARRSAIAGVLAGVMFLPACASTGSGPYATPSESARDPQRAQQLTRRAAELIDTDPAKAEALLRDALAADLYHGPAHNNLGVLFLKQGQLYEAAAEFQWARRLMPGHPDPRLNLGLALERGGRIDDAIAAYDAALEVYPNHLPTIMALAKCQIRHSAADHRTEQLLGEIAYRSNDPQWREWAQLQRAKLGH